jgi:hypothetical protein
MEGHHSGLRSGHHTTGEMLRDTGKLVKRIAMAVSWVAISRRLSYVIVGDCSIFLNQIKKVRIELRFKYPFRRESLNTGSD